MRDYFSPPSVAQPQLSLDILREAGTAPVGQVLLCRDSRREGKRNLKHLLVIAVVFFSGFLSPSGFAKEMEFPRVEKPAQEYFVGEKLTYKISYLGIPVGESESEIKEIVETSGRKAYHIVVRVHSYRLIDLVYKVRDEHHSYIDTQTLASLKYQKNIKEGRFQQEEVITYNQENHTAHYFYPKTKTEKEMTIPENAQDQLSCGYFFRTLTVEPDTSVFIPVNADEKNWKMEVKLHSVAPLTIKGVGRFSVLDTEPLMEFKGIFFHRGKIRGWISLDERRIPVKMTVKIPVLGNVTAELSEYIPGVVSQPNFLLNL